MGVEGTDIKAANNDKDMPADEAMWSLTVPTSVTVYLDFWGGDNHLEVGVKDWLLSTSSQWVRSSQIIGSAFTPS